MPPLCDRSVVKGYGRRRYWSEATLLTVECGSSATLGRVDPQLLCSRQAVRFGLVDFIPTGR